MRRVLLVVVAALAALAGVAPAAFAASASVSSPSSGSTVDGPTAVTVSVSKSLTESVTSVSVRLAKDGGAYPGSSATKLSCQSGCSSTATSQTWGGVRLDPRSPGAFGVSGPLPNGSYRIQPNVNGDGWGSGTGFVISYPPSPVAGLSGSADGRAVSLSWRRAPEPDVSGYRVERRRDGAAWRPAAELGPYADSYRETVPNDGSYDYRVITLRPSGTGGTLAATSSTVSVTASTAPPPPPPPSEPDPDDSGSATPGTPSDGGTVGSGDGSEGSSGGAGGAGGGSPGQTVSPSAGGGGTDGSPSGPATGGEDPTVGGNERPGEGRPRAAGGGRVARPPAARRGVSLSADVAPLPQPQPQVAPRAPEDTEYFGEDSPFSETLDYKGVDPVTGEPLLIPREETVTRIIPGALQQFLVERFDAETALRPIAGGLLLIALALHLTRWMRTP